MGRLLAASDIHGQISKFKKSLAKAGLIDKNDNWIGADSKLVICGDSIDRGENSCKTVEFIIQLRKKAERSGGEVIIIMGNHEAMLLDGRTHVGWLNCWLQNGGLKCVEDYRYILCDKNGQVNYYAKENPQKIYEHHREYFDNLKSHVIINDILFVHAGVNPDSSLESIESDYDFSTKSLHHLWIRDKFYNHGGGYFVKKYGVEKIVFGHTPATKYILNDHVSKMKPVELYSGRLLGIDTGSYYERGSVTIVEFSKDRTWEVASSV